MNSRVRILPLGKPTNIQLSLANEGVEDLSMGKCLWVEGSDGICSAVCHTFELLVERRLRCIWLEADSYPDPTALVVDFFRIIAGKTENGMSQRSAPTWRWVSQACAQLSRSTYG